MSKFWSLVLVALLVVGLYFHVFSIDPLSFVIIGILLWNNSTSLKQRQEMATYISKSHNVVVANQKTILQMIEAMRAELRRK